MTGVLLKASSSRSEKNRTDASKDRINLSQIILVSSSRSGTNYFLDVYARCFPEDVVLREIFRPGGDSLRSIAQLTGVSEADIVSKFLPDPLLLWKRIVDAGATNGKSVIAKIFYYHAPGESPLWRYFKSNSIVVHLIRMNLLDSFVSLKIAQSTGVWVSRQAKAFETPRRMSLDADEAEKFARERANQISWARSYFSGSNYREIFYEDIQASPVACAQAILGMKLKGDRLPQALPFDAPTTKHARPSNRELIENYAEVAHLDRDWRELEDVHALSN